MDNCIAIVAAILSIVALFTSGYVIVTNSNKKIREEKDLETKRLADEAWELEQDRLD